MKQKQSFFSSLYLFNISILVTITGLLGILSGMIFDLGAGNFFGSMQSVNQAYEKTLLRGNLHVPILMYHYVEYITDENDTIRRSLNINPDIFENQVKTLKDAGYTFLTVSELSEILNRQQPVPEKPVVLTFDDGHWDFRTVVMPILEKHGAKGTVFVITGRIGGSDFLSRKQLIEATKSAFVEVGSHSVNHNPINGVQYAYAEKEVIESKKYLEREFNYTVSSFAYPNGTYDTQAADIVRKAGYVAAVSTKQGAMQSAENIYHLSRVRPGKRTGCTLLEYLRREKQ